MYWKWVLVSYWVWIFNWIVKPRKTSFWYFPPLGHHRTLHTASISASASPPWIIFSSISKRAAEEWSRASKTWLIELSLHFNQKIAPMKFNLFHQFVASVVERGSWAGWDQGEKCRLVEIVNIERYILHKIKYKQKASKEGKVCRRRRWWILRANFNFICYNIRYRGYRFTGQTTSVAR